MSVWQHRATSRLARVCVSATVGMFIACGGDSPTKPSTSIVQSVVITPNTSALIAGNNVTLVATPFSSAGAALGGQAFTWSSSNTGIATVAASGVVTGVAAGDAIISAATAGRTGSASITVSAAPPRNFTIADAQFTQGVQSVDGSIPVILGTKPAVVNVMVAATTATTAARTQIVLRLFDANGTLVRTDTALTDTQFTANPTTGAPTVQFLVPGNVLQSGLRWQIVRDPKKLVTDSDAGDDVFPRSGTAILATAELPALTVRFVPITLGAHNNSTASLSTAQLPDFTRTLESAMPVAALSATIAPPFTSQSNFGATPRGGDLPFWTQLLNELDLARVLDAGDPRTYWVGVVIPPAGFNFAIYGGVGYVPFNGAQSGARTRTTALVGPGWYTNPTGARDGVAHELGHNFGRLHAPCGAVSASFDPDFPNAGGLIGTPGHDVYSWWKGLKTSASVITTDVGDVMGYCQQPWASPYTYDAALRFRRAGTVIAARVEESRQPVLIVQGSIESGRVTLQPAFTATAIPTQPQSPGLYRLEGFDNAGSVLFAYAFTPAVIDHAPNSAHFTFALPLTPQLQTSLAQLRVSSGAMSAERSIAASGVAAREFQTQSAVSISPPVTIARGRTGAVAAVCTNRDTQGILVQHDNKGAMLATNQSSTATFSARTGTSVRVQCSDGVRSTTHTMRVP